MMRPRMRSRSRPAGARLVRLCAGFTVIEVAVALSILSIGLMSMAAVIPLAQRDMSRSDQRTRTVFLAQQTAEWLHGLPYDDPLLVAGNHVQADFGIRGHSRSWIVNDNTPITNVKQVTVTVYRGDSNTTSLRQRQNAVVVFLHAQAGH